MNITKKIDNIVFKNKDCFIIFHDSNDFSKFSHDSLRSFINSTIKIMRIDEFSDKNDFLNTSFKDKVFLVNITQFNFKSEIFDLLGVKDFPCMMEIKNSELFNFSPFLSDIS